VILFFLIFVFLQSPSLSLSKPSLKLLAKPEQQPLSVLTNNAYHVFVLLCGGVNIDEVTLKKALERTFLS
jgi:hypothetical protein